MLNAENVELDGTTAVNTFCVHAARQRFRQ